MNSILTLPIGRGILYVCIAAVAWGTGGAVAAVLYETSGLGPVAVSFWRFAAGVLLLGAVNLLVRHHPADLRGGSRRQIVTTGAGLAIYQTAYFAAVGYAGLAIATVVTLGAGPVLIALGSHLMGERLSRAGAVTVTMALIGLILLVGGGGNAGTASTAPLGVACALLSAAGYAGVTLLNRNAARAGNGGGPRATVLGGFVVGMAILFPLALFEGLLPTSGDPGQVLGLFAYLGIAPTAVAYSLYFTGLTVVRATTASVIALIEPVTAAVIAVTLFSERLTVAATAGSIVLLGAVGTMALGEKRTRPAK